MSPEQSTGGKKPRAGFTVEEIKIFRIHAVLMAAFGAGMFVVAPKGLGQALGVLLAIILLPMPAVVIYFLRRCKAEK